MIDWLIIVAIAALVLYAAGVFALVILGRRGDARALAGFIPDCLVLFKRLIADPRVDRRRKGLLFGMVAYLASPIDLVPDFLPVVGYADDAILTALVLRRLVRKVGRDKLAKHWPGTPDGLDRLLRLLRIPN